MSQFTVNTVNSSDLLFLRHFFFFFFFGAATYRDLKFMAGLRLLKKLTPSNIKFQYCAFEISQFIRMFL